MGNCLSNIKAEMVPPPANPNNWSDMSPRRPQPVKLPKHEQGGINGAPLRREYLSNTPGLTYDQAGRPV
ncbi:hypothetical protein B0J14DRAFT_150422 [Halenospora varia]|nr:hypothetical protein B0J14DRAFT_150422 [Halenospora varia]